MEATASILNPGGDPPFGYGNGVKPFVGTAGQGQVLADYCLVVEAGHWPLRGQCPSHGLMGGTGQDTVPVLVIGQHFPRHVVSFDVPVGFRHFRKLFPVDEVTKFQLNGFFAPRLHSKFEGHCLSPPYLPPPGHPTLRV